MTGTTSHGIRYPNDPNAYADLITFFSQMASDVDKYFVPKTGDSSVSGVVSAASLRSTNGGKTQSSTVLQTGTSTGSFTIYDDNIRIDGVSGRRLWIAGANGTDVAIRTRSSGESLNSIDMRASNVYIKGAVTIDGTLNITGTKSIMVNFEADYTLAANASTWRVLPVTQVGFTFVTPPSGSVIIGFGGWVPTEGSSAMLSYAIREGPNIGTGNVRVAHKPASYPDSQPPPHGIAANGTGAGSTQWVSCYNAYLHKLTPNSTYNVQPYYRNANSVTLKLYRHSFLVQPDL